MSASRRAARTTFRPTFTITIATFVLFFLAISLLLVLPQLLEVASQLPPGPEQQQRAREVAAEAIRPKLPLALFAAALLTGLVRAWGRLPRLRRH